MKSSYPRMARASVPVKNDQGRLVGGPERDPDGSTWWVKRGLDPVRHRLNKPPAWATDTAHVDELQALGGMGFRLFLADGSVLEATVADFREHGLEMSRGFGEQVALPLKWWRGVLGPGGVVPRALGQGQQGLPGFAA